MTILAASTDREVRAGVSPAILGIGTANPPAVRQELALELAMELGCFDSAQKSWVKRLFLRSGIETRCSVLVTGDKDELAAPRRFYPAAKGPDDRGPTTAQRMARYAAEAPGLAWQSARMALENARIEPARITHLVTASCTGFFSPGLDAMLIERLGLSRGVRRIHVGFMGCHAAFNALAAARDAVAANPEARVLVCCVELCSLHLAYGIDPGKLVANALFADGSASAVVGHPTDDGEGAWQLGDFSSCLLEDSGDAMTWNIGDHGFEMTLSAGVPGIIRKQLFPWCEKWLARHELEVANVAGWAIHPGGPKILDAVGDALKLEREDLRFSRRVLAGYGNMSSTTILFILEQMAAEISGPCVAIGLGPGLMAEGILLNR
jgi:prepilin-type processing-associated H-X9-DG protein